MRRCAPEPTRIERDANGTFHLKRASDSTKDQSYFLFTLGQSELARTLFPLGAMAKTEVRERARALGLKNADKPEIHGGFASSHWCGNAACEAKIKEELKVTIRCLPFDAPAEEGKCVVCGERSPRRALWAKSY